VKSGREKGVRPLFATPFRLPTLCAIVDVDAAARAGWQSIDLARAFVDGGAQLLQVRAKHLSGAAFLDTASAIVELAHRHGALVIVNDRADIARLAGADGVHLGQDDLSPAGACSIVGDAALVGLSTHTTEQIDAAMAQPIAYLAIGPVFRTATKAIGHATVGLERVRDAAVRVAQRHLGVVAIGGVTLESARQVIEAGADSVAVISDLVSTGNPKARVRAYLQLLSRM